MSKILIIILTLCLSSSLLYGQNREVTPANDTLRTDTLVDRTTSILVKIKSLGQRVSGFHAEVKGFFHDEELKPKKALWMTFILPGLGQAYNDKHWKIPIVYTGIGALTYAIAYNNRNFQRYKKAYIYRLDGNPETIEETATQSLSDASLQNVREGFRKNLDRSVLGLLGFYILTGIDAYVDAHLSTFDIDDDLSLDWKPQLGIQGNPQVGVGLTLTFGYKKTKSVYIHPEFQNIKK